MALAFRDAAAFEVVLRSGVVPADHRDGNARVARDATLIVEPDRALSRPVLAKLAALGVKIDATLPASAIAVSCWAEALLPVRAPADTAPSLVLFVTPRVADLVELAAELVRLGCDRQELLVAGDRGIIRVVDPPTYTVVRAIDREGGLRVFVPDPASQNAVWCELGFHHPLASELRTPRESLVLITADEWLTIAATSWQRLDAVLELAVPGAAAPLAPGALPARRRIDLRLSAGHRDVPSLWLLRAGGVAAIDRLLEYLPDDVVARLVFAVSAGEAPTVILRARAGRQAAPDLSLSQAEEYAPLLHMPDIYVPVGAVVEPPLRRERLRSILGIAPREVMWLARDERDRIRTERIAETAFHPLADWADYVIHTSAPAIEPWLRSTVFDFAPYVSSGREWAEVALGEDPEKATARRRKRPAKEPEIVEEPPRPQMPAPVVMPEEPEPLAEVDTPRAVVDAELAALESEFIALDVPGDAPERLALFVRLGRAYARLRRRRDADLCFVRAVWEASPERAAPLVEQWIKSLGGKPDTLLARALTAAEPASDDVRIVALLAARAASEIAADPHRVQRWLDDHDSELDARTLWLSRLGLARLAGGDPLTLAHARDRVLARLAGGLPVERELPAFLRLAGRSGALGTSADHIANALDDLARRFATTKRKRSPLEAPATQTNAYVGFILANGFARVGRPDRARAFMAGARQALAQVASDPVHAYLIGAFSARVEQSLEGVSADTPLPPELGTQLAALDRVARYKVDRLREASHILEPHERPDPISAYGASLKDARGPEFATLREIADPVQRARALDKLVAIALADARERPRLLDGIFDVLLELPESAAMPLFTRAAPLVAEVPVERRAVLYADALVVVGHFGRTELVPGLLAELAAAMPAAPSADIERVLRHSVRALRRIGLRDQVVELLATAENAIPAGRADALRARLALAAGLAYLGDRRAQPIFDQARSALSESMAPAARLEVTRALALAYANAPLDDALAGISELSSQLRDITDNLGTNSHFCLAVLHFMESLVLGITSDDLALGEAGRRFIEDDEHLIRRRLHRDLGGAS